MSMTGDQMMITAIMLGYLIFNVAVGMYMSKRQEAVSTMSDEKKYFIGSRGMNGLVLAMTTIATYTSVSSFVSGPGATGIIYGYSQSWVAAVQCGAGFLVLGVLGNKMAIVSRRTGAVTIAGYFKARYKSDFLVVVLSLIMVGFFIAQMVGQFTGGAVLVQSVTGLDYRVSLVIFALVVIAYTSFGGFTAVVITDTIQGIIMLLGTFLFIFFVFTTAGGMDGINAGLAQNLPKYKELYAVYQQPGQLLSYWVLVGFGVMGLPATAVRGMGFKSTKDLKSALVIGTITCIVLIVGMHVAGVWCGALINKAELDAMGMTIDGMVPVLVQKIMPTPIAGLFLAAPLAAVMSTVSSLLILASAAIVKDLWHTYFVKNDPAKTESFHKNFSKISMTITFLIGLLTVIFSLTPPQIIFMLNIFALGGLESSFFWPLVGGIFYRKGTKQAAIASSITGTAAYILFQQNILPRALGLHGVCYGLLIGGIFYFVVGKMTIGKGLDQDVLDTCF